MGNKSAKNKLSGLKFIEIYKKSTSNIENDLTKTELHNFIILIYKEMKIKKSGEEINMDLEKISEQTKDVYSFDNLKLYFDEIIISYPKKILENIEHNQQNIFLKIPKNVKIMILSFMPLNIILKISMTCKELYRIFETEQLWKILLNRDFSGTEYTEEHPKKVYQEQLSVCGGMYTNDKEYSLWKPVKNGKYFVITPPMKYKQAHFVTVSKHPLTPNLVYTIKMKIISFVSAPYLLFGKKKFVEKLIYRKL
eukprot:TRINITY_DN4802_c0_g1_i1.p1 TRINITY_DN4802_c0_g1~~TRINITY_DN4802_c0_g1_i1.p1  ORF type:complete len:252 (-),score=54.27 TRINITY_DN4802_c0_g1_i1:225-980(-)